MKNENIKKAKMFNKKASKKKFKSNKVIETLTLKKGFKIADIGSGGGFFTIKFAQIVGDKGHIYAIDVNLDFLDYIKSQSLKYNLKNITTLHSEDDKPQLPKEKLDYIFLRNVYHHLPNRINYLEDLGKSLIDKGKIVIIEHNGSGYLNFNRLFGHNVKPDIIINEMKKAGYVIDNQYFFIRQQSFNIFKKSKRKS